MKTPVEPLDELFVNFDTKTTHQSIGLLCSMAGRPNIGRLKRDLEQFVGVFPRFRQVMKSGDDGVFWADDVGFEVDRHLEVCEVEGLESEDDVANAAAGFYQKRLDDERPRWRVVVFVRKGAEQIEEVSGFFFQLHHSIADGIGAIQAIETLFSKTAGGEPAVYEVNNDSQTTLNPFATSNITFNSLRGWSYWLKERFSGVKCGPLNGENGVERKIAVSTIARGNVQFIKRAAKTTQNDVVLCIVAMAVRKYCLEKGVEPSAMRAVMPVSLRGLAERFALGNKLTGIGVPLPVEDKNNIERLKHMSQFMTELKEGGALGAYRSLTNFVSKLPATWARRLCESQARRTNFIVTNMPAPHKVRYFAGAKIRATYGIAALMRGHGVAFGFLSYANKICVSVASDAGIVDDPEVLAGYVSEASEELLKEVVGE